MPPRVALFAPNWLGDVVMALPAVAGVCRHFKDGEVVAVARPSVAPMLGAATGLAGVVAIDHRDEPRRIAAERFDIAILLPNSFASAWLARRAGIPERWGYRADWRGWLLTRAVLRPRGRFHHSAYYARLVEALGMAAPPVATAPLSPPVGARQAAEQLLTRCGWRPGTRLVVLAPGAAYGHAKRWPPARFAALAASIVARHHVAVAIVGGPSDRDAALEIDAELSRLGAARASTAAGAGWIDLVGQTTLPVLMGVASMCEAFVSNDSGAMHLAAAVGVPVTAIFGATDERATGPMEFGRRPTEAGGHRVLTSQAFCRPCLLRECPIDHRCMKRIDVARVAEAVAGQLKGEPATGDAAGAAAGLEANG